MFILACKDSQKIAFMPAAHAIVLVFPHNLDECLACEQAHLWVTCASDPEQSDLEGRSLFGEERRLIPRTAAGNRA